ncbi:hypothetical protein E2C01_061133 [Portunus trituberculatus]|uniref:Uncharacterized protein n=1 Tax=Portunus trituberculatus TaxID=210409 RepID=A0A5B7H9X8_PORTR|nr:hypothetical protein [Portunus trituberculatus]
MEVLVTRSTPVIPRRKSLSVDSLLLLTLVEEHQFAQQTQRTACSRETIKRARDQQIPGGHVVLVAV